MKISKLFLYNRIGFQEALRAGLDKEENWTPLLTHIHFSRMLIGLLLGFLCGAFFTFFVVLIANGFFNIC